MRQKTWHAGKADWPKQSPYFEVLKTEVYPAGSKVSTGSFMPKNDKNSNTVKRKLDCRASGIRESEVGGRNVVGTHAEALAGVMNRYRS